MGACQKSKSKNCCFSISKQNLPRHHLSRPKTETEEIKKIEKIPQEVLSTPVGLANLGNTCYMNSIIQCIAYLPSFNAQLMNLNNELSSSLLNLINSLKKKEPTQSSLTQFKSVIDRECIMFRNTRPNESKAFLSQLLDLLSPETHETEKCFLNTITYKFYCNTCKKASSANHEELYIQIMKSNSFSSEDVNRVLQRIVEIGTQSGVYCKQCHKQNSPTNAVEAILHFPDILLVYLGEARKNESLEGPLRLELKYSNENASYSLMSVYNGYPGHATSIIKYNGKWFHMNDERVSSVQRPFSEYSVILFYQKNNKDA